MNYPVEGVDWALLRAQKETLLHVIACFAGLPPEDHLTGILHLVDAIQDKAAADSGIGIEAVFGALDPATKEHP